MRTLLKISLPVIVPALLAFAYLVSFRLSMCVFTWGDLGLDQGRGSFILFLASKYVLIAVLFEILFRQGILRWFLSKYSIPVSMLGHLIIVNLVIWFVAPYNSALAQEKIWFWILYENTLQIIWALIFIKGGSTIYSIVAHALFNIIRFIGLGVIDNPINTMFYVVPAVKGFFPAIMLWNIIIILLLYKICKNQKTNEIMPLSNRNIPMWMGRALYMFAIWTVTIKFIIPIAWSLIWSLSLTRFILWDAWWIAHLYVGYLLIEKPHKTWPWIFVLTLTEIGVIGFKFIGFYESPVFNVWRMNWYVNKWFMLIYFVFCLEWILRDKTRRSLKCP